MTKRTWRVGSARPRQETLRAAPAHPLRRGHPCVRAFVRPSLLAARPGAADRRDPDPGAPHRGERAADHRPLARAPLRQLPPRAQPRGVVPARRRQGSARAARQRLRAGRARGAGPRRYDRTALGAAHRRPRHLPRSRAIVRRPLRQDERPALDEPDAARARSLGWPGLGVAVPDRARPLRTVLPRAGAPAQTPARRRAATRAPGAPLAARPRPVKRHPDLRGTATPTFTSSLAGRDGWTRPPRHQALDCFSASSRSRSR